MHKRRIAILVTSFAIALAAFNHPSADIRIITHQSDDSSPRRFQAAIDTGIVAFSVLVTWTARRIAD